MQIGNAIKFTLEGEVRVTVYMGDRCSPPYKAAGSPSQSITPRKAAEYRFMHVDIVDTGIGIKPMDVPKLFNKFVQADSSTTRNFGGTGLGLAISRKFVEVYCSPTSLAHTPTLQILKQQLTIIYANAVDGWESMAGERGTRERNIMQDVCFSWHT